MPLPTQYASAANLDLPDGRRIWFPAGGRPYWTHTNPAVTLTDAEIAEHLPAYEAAMIDWCQKRGWVAGIR